LDDSKGEEERGESEGDEEEGETTTAGTGARYKLKSKMRWQSCKMMDDMGVAGYTLKEYSIPQRRRILIRFGSLVCQRRYGRVWKYQQ
jgi:hypothetical protein